MTHREVQLTDNRKHRQTSLSSEEHTLQLTGWQHRSMCPQITRTYSPLRAFKRHTGTTARTGGLWPRYNSVLFFYISQYCNGPKKLHAVTAWFLLCFHLLKWCCWLVNAKVCSWDQSTKNMHQMKLLQLLSKSKKPEMNDYNNISDISRFWEKASLFILVRTNEPQKNQEGENDNTS